MKILYECHYCNSTVWGMLRKRTNYDNTTNMDELDLVCEICGEQIGRVISEREFCGFERINSKGKKETYGSQEEMWQKRRKEIEEKRKQKNARSN